MKSRFAHIFKLHYEVETENRMEQSGYIYVAATSRESAKKKVVHLMKEQVPDGHTFIVDIKYMDNDVLL